MSPVGIVLVSSKKTKLLNSSIILSPLYTILLLIFRSSGASSACFTPHKIISSVGVCVPETVFDFLVHAEVWPW